jgi:MFS family permease
MSSARLDQSTATGSIATAIALIALVGIGLSLSLPLLSLEMTRMGVSASGIGMNTAIAGLASIALVPYIPTLAARFGVGRIISISLLLTIAMLAAFYLVRDYWAWFVFRFIYSACLGALFVLSEYWITTTAPAAKRGLVMGIYATILALGFAIGPALLAIVGTEGFAPYLAGIGLFAISTCILWFARSNIPALSRAPRHSTRRYLLAVPLATLAGFASGAVEIAGMSLLPVFGLSHGFDANRAALLVTAVQCGNVASQIPLGLLSDRMSKALLLALIGAIGLLLTLALPLAAASGTLPLFALLFAWGGVGGGLYTIGLAHLAANYRGPDLAGGNAAFIVMFNLGLMAGPPFVGATMDASRTHGFSWGIAPFFALILIAWLIQSRRNKSNDAA